MAKDKQDTSIRVTPLVPLVGTTDHRTEHEKRVAYDGNGKGEVVTVLAVPYFQRSAEVDHIDFTTELFLDGAFSAWLDKRTAYAGQISPIGVTIDHKPGRVAGFVIGMYETREGLMCDVRLNDSVYAAQVWQALKDRAVHGVSAEFIPTASRVNPNRVKGGQSMHIVSAAQLIGLTFALDEEPAYKSAKVISGVPSVPRGTDTGTARRAPSNAPSARRNAY